MSEPELIAWDLRSPVKEDMFDFRIRRVNLGIPYRYAVEAKRPTSVLYVLAEFTTSEPLTNALHDACINLVRCSA
jgi:hypothetical protein